VRTIRREKKRQQGDSCIVRVLYVLIALPVKGILVLIGYVLTGAFDLLTLPIKGLAALMRPRRGAALAEVEDGYAFERYVADRLHRNGFAEVRTTSLSGDFGVDVLAEKGGVCYAFQCKHYRQPGGVKAVQEVHAGMVYYDCHVGVVVASSTFTPAARELAERTGVELWDRRKLLALR
jgi:HJR/Mrr/RecB family endonuclease